MGGKRKQAQRTKNNTRPSSSGRSAELLGTLPQFVGFSGIKESNLTPAGFTLGTEDDTLIDTNFQLVFKKMNKKDSITKLKALQEFTDLVKSADVEAIKAVLPFWPRLYCVLAIDSEHKVREATQLAHHQLVIKAKRNIAPYLKLLAGTWFISQYDTYAPAASAATRAFEDSFPHNKLQEAIIFCQEEILSYICDNLTMQTPQTLSTSKTTPVEDAEAKYQRVVISSLNSYALYLCKVPGEQLEKQSELNLKIISNAKFWKLGKNKLAPIRSAWFAVLTMLCQKAPSLMEKESSHIVGSVFSNIDESEPVVLPAVWEAALSILSLMKEWWKYVNVDKLVLPKLYKVLKDGGNGNAAVIFPNLLPVLSHLPAIIDAKVFYPSFFENMRVGLKTKHVLGSRSESQAVSVALIECLQYVIMKNQTDIGLCEKLIKTQLFPLLEWSMNDPQSCYKSLYNQVAKLVQFWDRNVRDYEKYLVYFWHNLESLYLGLLANLTVSCDVITPAQVATRQIELVLSLKHLTKNKKLLKVSFSPEQQEASNPNVVADFTESYKNSLHLLVFNTCKAYVKVTNELRSNVLIEHLVCLIRNFDSDSFVWENESTFSDIYMNVLLKWLKDDVLCSKPVVDLIFMLFKYFKDEEKMGVLAGFCNDVSEECLGWCITQGLSHPNCKDPLVLNWLYDETVSRFLIKIAEQEISQFGVTDLSLILKRAFTERSENELLISRTAVLQITKIFTRPLLDPFNYTETLDNCASFASYISTIIYSPHFKLSYGEDILLALFTLSNSVISDDILSTDTYWEVNTAWQDVIYTLIQEIPYDDFKKIAEKCSEVVWQSCTDNSVDVIVNFVKIVSKNSPLRLKDVLTLFLKRDLIDKWRNDICNICEQAEYTEGRLSLNHEIAYPQPGIDENDIEKYFEWMNLVIGVLIKPLEDESKELFNHIIDMALLESDFIVLEVFSSLTLRETFLQNYQCTKSCQNLKETTDFQERLDTLINSLSPAQLKSIERLLLERLNEGNWLGFNTFYKFYFHCGSCDLSNKFTELTNQMVNSNRSCLLQLSQTWAKHITYDQIWANLSTLETIVVLRSIIFKPELEVQIAEAFALIERIKRQNQNDFIFSGNLQWEKVELIIEIIRLFSGILKYRRECVQANHWDLVLTSFVTWCENVAKSLNKSYQIKSLIVALTDLFVSISDYIKICDNQSVINEWRDIFAQDVHSYFLEIWCYYAGDYVDQSKQHLITDLPFLQNFGKLFSGLETTYIFSKNSSPKWTKLLSQSCSLLTHPLITLQLWGYHMIIKLIPELVKIDTTAVSTNTPHQNGLIMEQFKKTLLYTQEIVQSMLLEFRLAEDSCSVKPFTDSYTYTFAYLLLWDILLSLCEQSSTELRYQYSDWLRREDFVDYLLINIFKLVPLEMETKGKPYSSWFITKCSVDFTEAPTSRLTEKMVCWIYLHVLMQLPVLVRQWWCNQESRVAQLVERITSTYVSSHLCNQELADLTKHVHKFKNMTIKTHPTVREVVAIYTIDEVQMELIITLPLNYPLVGPDVHCNKQILGTSHRQWLMQLKMCVLHQDGRIWDGLLLWNNNLDKRFDGVEECYICFAVIHQGTYQIPKLSCQTCKKKFHSACLYKWFSTSNKSSCPVCRNLF